MPVAVTAKALGGTGAKARLLVVAQPTAIAAKTSAPTSTRVKAPIPTAVKEIASASNLTAQILGAASNGIIALDVNGAITLANPAAADLLARRGVNRGTRRSAVSVEPGTAAQQDGAAGRARRGTARL